ncbi:FG-GAP-like repeat-containing protein [Winogradskyella sp.]|uniref:FG-GAP-like repeat-containing protein n=1 Tax=Winogradskyella sp. TaxID=1883156 RepID=UPI003AA7D2F2
MKKTTLLLIAVFTFSLGYAQVLNENANWPNSNWSLTGTYDATHLYENPTTTSSNFSFDDDDAGNGSDNNFSIESPVINLTNANNAGETHIYLNINHVFNAYLTEVFTIEYWDSENTQWVSWGNIYDTDTPGAPTSNYCNGTFYSLDHPFLDISGFSSNQLSGFKYRISYDDNEAWGYGFCFESPTILSQTPPACPNPTNLNVSNVSETNAYLQWTEAGSSSSWNIQWGTSGFSLGSGTVIPNVNSTTYNLNGLSQGTSYDFYVQANCNGGGASSYIGPFNFSTSTPGGTCISSIAMQVETDCSSATPTTFDFSIATDIDANNENPTCDASVNYGYFVSFTAPTIGSVIFNFGSGANGIGLEVYESCGGATASSCFNNVFDNGDTSGLIGGLTPGATYYAVIWRDSQSGTADICIEEGASCPDPSSLDVTSVSLDSAILSWEENGIAGSWNIEWETTGFTPGSGNVVSNVTATNYNLMGLSPGTSYDFYVQSNCTDETSDFSGPFTFTTQVPSRINFSQQAISVSGYDMAVVDMNGDFLDDIVGVSSTNINVQEQNPDGSFTNKNITTPEANYLPGWSMAAADFDANGKTDLLYGAGNGVTFMQASNDGLSFTEQSTTQYVFSQRSNFVDINNDGNLDAFVCHDVEPNVYFINDGTGNFTFYQSDVTSGAPYSLGNYPTGGDYGSIWIDYNNDRNIDLFIAKCGGSTERRTNMMVTNNGDDTFTENAAAIGLADPMQTWSSAWGDFDNDGDMDVYVGASSGTHKLMENSGFSDDGNPNNDYIFTDVTAGAGIVAPTGWESSVYDIDNDGYLDIVSNGTIMYGKGDMTFEDADDQQINYKNGSFGDLNNDGFIDLYYSGVRYYNQGNSNNWVKINTVGMAHVTPNYSNRNGIGARVELVTPSGTQIRDVRSGEGFEFMSSLNTHFGLGTETSITEIRVYWPSGVVDVFENPSINSTHVLVEGTAPLSISDETFADISIYPNPVDDVLKIKTSEILTEKIATIFDVTGKRVFNQMITNNELDVSKLQGGVYFLRIESNGRSLKRKFIKK